MTSNHTVSALRSLQRQAANRPADGIEAVATPPAEGVPLGDDRNDVDGSSVLRLIELILKSPRRLDRLVRRDDAQDALIPRFVIIALTSFALFASALTIVFSASGVVPQLTAVDRFLAENGSGLALVRFEQTDSMAAFWRSGTPIHLIIAYSCGLIAATGVCLPSLYFYGLLSGVRLSMREVVAHAMKAKATSAVALMGILPIYIALALGVAVFDWIPSTIEVGALWLGLVLPFIAGIWGTSSLYRAFSGLSDTLSADRRERRVCFLRRLVFSWAACYTAVSPLMIFTLLQWLQSSSGVAGG